MQAPDGTLFGLDSAVLDPDPDGELIQTREICSIIGRYLPELIASYPELGGFRLPAVIPAFTAVNKLDALHRRNAAGSNPVLARRIRDVLDLGAIANSEHADDVRQNVADLVPRMTIGAGHKEPRPETGYGSSTLYQPHSAGYEALRHAYYSRLPDLVPSGYQLPDFDEMMAAIRDLDLP